MLSRMKNRNISTVPVTQPRVIASFGRANLVRIGGANYELPDASADDLTAAKEWISLFMHEAVLTDAPSLQRRATNNSRWKLSSLGKSE